MPANSASAFDVELGPNARCISDYFGWLLVGVSFGLSTPPEFGITVSFRFVGSMFGNTSTRFSGLSAAQSIPPIPGWVALVFSPFTWRHSTARPQTRA
jgi:hypothetical protein